MKTIKFGVVILMGLILISGCGSDNESNKDVENNESVTLSCTYKSESRNVNNEIELKFEDEKIIEATMSFASDNSFDQSYADSVCESYEMNEGITCEATVTGDEDNYHTVYEIEGTDDEGTKAFLNFREDIEGESFEEIKESFEDNAFDCE